MRIPLAFVVAVAGTLGCERGAVAPAGCGVTSLALTGINARSILAGRHETLEVSTVSGFAPPLSSCVAWRSTDPGVLSIISSGVVSSFKIGRAMVNDLVVTPGWNIVSAGPASRGGEWIVATARKDAGDAIVPVLLHRADRF